MDAFSFVFSFFSIVLGLAMTEVLGGMRKGLQSRKKVRIGWLTPMLGLVVALDITSFWMLAWAIKGLIPPYYLALCCGFVVTGIYYLVAGLVFPEDPAEWPNYDDYYFEHRRIVVGGVISCNLLAMAFQALLGLDVIPNLFTTVAMASQLALCALLFLSRTRAQNMVLLIVLAASYPGWALADLTMHFLGYW